MTKTIATVSLILAFLFEYFIFDRLAGHGFLLFWSATFAGTLYLLHSAERLRWMRLWMFLPSLLFAFSLFRYDAAVVRFWGTALGLASLAWAVAWNLVNQWSTDVLSTYFPKETWNPIKIAGNAKESLRFEPRWDRETVKQVVRGVMLASVLLLVFGTLLAAADAVFSAKLESLGEMFSVLSPTPLVRFGLWLGLTAGLLKVWLCAPPASPTTRTSIFSATELMIAIGALNTLLVAFLCVQARYLFGGSSLLESLGLTHAEYARRGFFELSLCIALILPIVLLAYQAGETHRDSKLRLLGGGLILSAFGLAISALRRMMLYISIFGLSVERFYAASGIVVAMSILAWALYCCIKPHSTNWLLARQNITTIILLSLLGLVNVDAVVANSQLQRVVDGTRSLDVDYLSYHLGLDALPIIKKYESRLPEEQRLQLVGVGATIKRVRLEQTTGSLNIARLQAEAYDFSED